MPKMTIEDLTGQVYGYQEIVSFSHKQNGNHFWNVKCVCGYTRPMQVSSLKSGKSKSCGCKTLTVVTGKKFGRLTVVRKTGKKRGKKVEWECLCDCGNTYITTNSYLTHGTKSCGCLTKEILSSRAIHGREGTPIYSIIQGMIGRCTNPNNEKYKIYGARGICVCDEWMRDKSSFFDWADANGYKEGLQIDRIDNNGNYEPSNCRWVTSKTNNRNRRDNHPITSQGKTLLLCEWAELLEVNSNTLMSRITRGYSNDEVVSPFNRRTGERLCKGNTC